jgi:Mg/Co/Ni transporter MgtE
VSDFLAPSIATCKTTATCDDVKTLLLSRNVGDAYIVDDAGQFVGVVNGSDLAAAAGKEDRPVSDLVRSAAAVVLATDTVETAVRAILAAGRNYLPVVRSSEDQFLVGSVSARELLRAVNMALISADAEAKIR